MRSNVTEWYRFARGYQATVRTPYYDLEVVPASDGWSWKVLRMDTSSGQFATFATGRADELDEAKSEAMQAVTERTDWVELIRLQLVVAGLTAGDLSRTLIRNGSDSYGSRDQAGLQRCYLWLTRDHGLQVVRDSISNPE